MKYTLLHINIEKKKHLDKIEKLLESKQPDIVCFQEIYRKDITHFAEKFSYEYIHAAKFYSKDVEDGEGQGILSKYPLKNIQKQRYGQSKTKSLPQFFSEALSKRKPKRPLEQFQFHETLLSAQVELEGRILTVATTHFPVSDLTSPGLNYRELYDTESLNYIQNIRAYFDRFLLKIRKLTGPLIFTSDLNNPRGEYVYDTLSHELIDQVPKSLESSLDPELHRIKDLKLMVDTVMTSRHIKIEDFEVIEGVSDHKAFFVRFNIFQ